MRILLAALLMGAAFLLAIADWQATLGEGYAYRLRSIDQALAGVWPAWHARFVEGWQVHGFLLWDPVGAFLMALPLALVLAAFGMLVWVSRARR
jgi:hypothetical protein